MYLFNFHVKYGYKECFRDVKIEENGVSIYGLVYSNTSAL